MMPAEKNNIETSTGFIQSFVNSYKELTDHSPLPVVITEGKDNFIRYANQAFLELCRRTSEQSFNHPLVDVLPRELNERLLNLLDRVYKSRKTESLTDNIQFTGKDKSPKFFSYKVSPVGGNDNPAGMMIQAVKTTGPAVEDSRRAAITESLTLCSVRQHQSLERAFDDNKRLILAVRESEHRAKNSLQTISSLIGRYARSNPDITAPFELEKIQLHILTVGKINDLLTHGGKDAGAERDVSIHTLFAKIQPLWIDAIGIAESDLEWKVEDVSVSVEKGAAIVLIVNELLCNAVKNGATKLEFHLNKDNGNVTFEITDNGPGFPENFTSKGKKSFGLRFIENTCKNSLKGQIAYKNREARNGARVIVTFPLTSKR